MKEVRNPLKREGTSQKDRYPDALHPSFSKLDDRDLYDYLDFVYRYSENIRFWPSHSTSSNKVQNWQLFFSAGIILLSHIKSSSSKETLRQFKDLLAEINEINAEEQCKEIEKILLGMFKKIENWFKKFHHEDNFKDVIFKIISNEHYTLLKQQIKKAKEIYPPETKLKKLTEAYQNINSEIILYYDGVIKEAEDELKQRLKNGSFEPHIGLLLSFLEMFQKSRDLQNGLTERHLDFYYQDILQLEKKAFTPDEAHITIGLARNVEKHQLSQGTLFKAGKDSNSNEISYELTEDFTANKSVVSEIRSSFKDKEHEVIRVAYNSKTINGIDEELKEDDPVWAPFEE